MVKDSPQEHLISRAQQLLQDAVNVVALTGAGVSTPSGIPDFRSPGSGLWERANPLEVASMNSEKANEADRFEIELSYEGGRWTDSDRFRVGE